MFSSLGRAYRSIGSSIVDIELINGQRLERLTVIDSTYLVLEEENELIEPKDILSIKLHK